MIVLVEAMLCGGAEVVVYTVMYDKQTSCVVYAVTQS